jgi:hypothetical protein
MPITQVYLHAKFSFQINWALKHMIKIHNFDERPSSLVKISLSEKEEKITKMRMEKRTLFEVENYNDFLIPSFHHFEFYFHMISLTYRYHD